MNSTVVRDCAEKQLVLIDTWWNVNEAEIAFIHDAKTVLIDTWWNVNTTSFIMSINNHFRFNRYMVECE